MALWSPKNASRSEALGKADRANSCRGRHANEPHWPGAAGHDEDRGDYGWEGRDNPSWYAPSYKQHDWHRGAHHDWHSALILVHTAVRTGIRGMAGITANMMAPMKEAIMIGTVVLTTTGTELISAVGRGAACGT